jgi:hypothetical protein
MLLFNTACYKHILSVYTLISRELATIVLLKSDVLIFGLSELRLLLEV